MKVRTPRPRPVARARTRVGNASLKVVFAVDWAHREKVLKKLARQKHLSVSDVHDLRVTTRRLRASLSVLRHCTELHLTDRVRRELRALGNVLGERRTADIAMRDAAHYDMEMRAIRARRSRSRKALQTALAKRRVDTLIADVRKARKEIATAPIEKLGPWLELLQWELAYLAEYPPKTAERRHELRIQMKKVRYILEAFGRRSLVLQKLQDHLGREHDLAVLQDMVGTKEKIVRDARRERVQADRAMAPALRMAMRNLKLLRRDLAR